MTIDELKNKKRIAVLGCGQEGQAIVQYLLKHGITPVLFDRKSVEELGSGVAAFLATNSIECISGPDYLQHLSGSDVIFRSPGIWRLTPELLTAEDDGAIITSQVQWFFDNSPAHSIGITGTKGKGTTSSLIQHLLLQSLKTRVFLTGNIGKTQPLEILDDLMASDVVVYELSSFQLQDLQKSPEIGVILMVTSEHLDHHADVTEYRHAKEAISKFQGESNTIVINDDFPASQAIGALGTGHKLYFSRTHEVTDGAYVHDQEILITKAVVGHEMRISLSHIPLRGEHNYENVMAAIIASLVMGAAPDSIAQALSNFKSLPHRLQQLPSQGGIEFFDDSFATVPENTIAALNAFTNPLIVIMGGSDKGASFDVVAKHIVTKPNIKAVVLIGTVMAPKIKEALLTAGYTGTIKDGFKDLDPAMRAIKQIAVSGDTVLLSPACASFDSYKNYVERGDHFQSLAAQWPSL